jgi:exonuclease SbcD
MIKSGNNEENMRKLKLLHTADNHFGNKKELLNEAVTVTDFIVNIASEEKPDLAMITGDLYDERVMLDSPAALAGISFVRRLAAICTVLIIKGTELHDFDSLDALQGLSNVTIVSDLRQVGFHRDYGIFDHTSSDLAPHAVISCLPSLSKSFLVSLGKAAMAADEEIVALVGQFLKNWGVANRRLTEKGVVTIVGGHGTIAGAVTSTGQVMLGHDLTYGTDDLAAAQADYVGFGHIHKAQKVGPAWYCGSSGRVDAGEKEPKGFNIVELAPGVQSEPRFTLTPARQFLVEELGFDPTADDWKAQLLTMKAQLEAAPNPDKLVPKIKVVLSETNATNVTRKEVEAILGREVIFDKEVVPIERSRAEGISKVSAARDKFIKWAECAGQRQDDDILALVEMLDMPKDKLLEAVAKQFDEECSPTADVNESSSGDTAEVNQTEFALS